MEALAVDEKKSVFAHKDIAYEVLYPLLEAHRADIEQVARRTYRYGTTNRRQLDVYYPSSTSTGRAPVLFFVYGGGYAGGSRKMSPPHELVYANVGAFFAKHGLITVITDYRVLPDAKFPDPAADVRDALVWFASHAADVNAGSPVKVDSDSLFIMGHSVGADIVATLFLLPDFLPPDLHAHVRGLILKGGAYHYQTKALTSPPETVLAYYGSEGSILRHQPLTLLREASEDTIHALPEVLTYVSEHELATIRESSVDFHALLSERLGRPVETRVMAGHNHISPHIALGTGLGEEWAVEVAEWAKARIIRPSL
ncbi:alpha/beta hydrolase [Phanerochaete sordida]|uniref:Alpha/beta hydrolase n=1 Tax=Phanerochaete sordida TaxID=48140 RepID=A0A9P3G917_9APHY|nr:alpha/beta hydrolase [Phanerochaete sordida]